MFLLGHSCWSYLFSKASGRTVKVSVPAYLAFLSGTLPDFDIYFGFLGLQHHTWSHSLLVLVPLAVVLTYFFGRLGFALSIGILSHILGDGLVGNIPLLYPLYPSWTPGLNLGIPSLADTALEMGAFGLVIVYALWNGDYKLVLKPSRDGLLLGIPLVAIDTLTLLFAGDRKISLISFAFSRKALTLITLGHIVLSGILALGVLQGLVWYYRSRKSRVDAGNDASSGVSRVLGRQVTSRLNVRVFKEIAVAGGRFCAAVRMVEYSPESLDHNRG
jgi:LexA-binding, inner membrane-associated putative hydrolase